MKSYREASRKNSLKLGSLGTGYVSIIMLFVMICLTTLALLSFSAASSNSDIIDKSRTNTNGFYDAECKANRTLMQIDSAAADAAESGLFSTFADTAGMIEGVIVSPDPGGYKVSWSESITDKLTLICEAKVYSEPEMHGNKRYEITKWHTSAQGASTDAHINVWDGTF